MLLSAWTGETVPLPIDEVRFHAELQQRIETSRFEKPAKSGKTLETSGSY